jgi:hypothetical protein
MPTQKRAEKAVRLIPVAGVYIQGEPAVEREVTPEEADRLLSYRPPAFVKAPPAKPVATDDADPEPQE